MVDDPEQLIMTYYAALARGDANAVLACFADDIELCIHISPEVLPFGGVSVGLKAAEERLRLSFKDWECEKAEAVIVRGGGDLHVAADCSFAFRHKASGALLEGRLHNRFVIETGKIRRMDEWMDDAAVQAFVAIAEATSRLRLRNHDATIH